ncbi:MAG: radical SAM protein [Deltaproteobacteria bacterium]|nr:radical SAM protein [Deltaproteobacteria bacterium]
MRLRASLLFPPEWTAAQPHFAIASLSGQLRRAGHDVVVHDLNLDLVSSMLDGGTLGFARSRAESERRLLSASAVARLAAEDRSESFSIDAKKLLMIERYLERGPSFDRVVEDAVEARGVLRDERFYDPLSLADSLRAVDRALELYSLPFHPNEVRWNDFYAPLVRFDFEVMRAFTEDAIANPFLRFFESKIRRIFRDESQLLAISINAFSQVLPGLTLARLLMTERNKRREAGQPGPHIAIGGNFFSRLKGALSKRPELFTELTDSLVLGEGEGPIVKLMSALDPDSPVRIEDVPNLLYLSKQSRAVAHTFSAPGEPMNSLAFQDFSGIDLSRYLSPERVVCVRLSKGCYYGQCTFCDSHYGLGRDWVSVERLVEELRHLRNEFGIRHFELVDQAISPADLRALSQAIIDAKLDVSWFGNGWTDPRFTREDFDLARRAGATMLMWGIETASPRLLKAMKKGVSPKRRMEVLADSHAAGIWNFAYVFFGFPTETEEEALSTIALLESSLDVIHSYGRSVFTLNRHSPLFQDAAASGIVRTIEDDQEFSTYVSFETSSGISGDEVTRMAARCNEVLRKAQGDPLWMALRSRENLHLYLARHGKDFVRTYRFADEAPAVAGAEFVF